MARSAFEQINHHRGLALTVKLASEFKKLKAAKSKHKATSKSLEPDKLGDCLDTASRVVVDSLPFNNEDSATLEKLYQKHMRDFREQQRKLQPSDMRQELCITRL